MSDYNSGENQGENTNVSENEVESKKILYIGDTLTDGLNISINNIGPILVNILFWVLTIWIPYLNVGTTIGMYAGIISKISRGETVSYTEIFDPKYRKFMGDYFLTLGLIFIGVLIGIFFLIIPGIILSLAWSFASILVVDKGKNPTEAIKLSNDITYGHKGRMLLITLILSVIFGVIQTVLKYFDNDFATFLLIILAIIQMLLSFGVQASIYKQLAGDV